MKRIFLSPPHMGGDELKYIHEAFGDNFIAPCGPAVDAFERECARILGIPHTLAVSSGTAAMHLALREAGVGTGDTVIASTLTFIGSISPAIFLGAIPVFIDSDIKTWTMDSVLLEKEINECVKKSRLPKAVIPTDIYGQCADLDRIQEICSPFNIPVIVDSAEAMGSKYRGKHAGVGSKASIYSFNGNKIITTSGGGLLASDDPAIITHARFLSMQARELAPHYEHTVIGYNYRMSNIVAAIGLGQLTVLNERVKRKREIFNLYENLLKEIPGIEFMPEALYGECNRWLTVILIDKDKFGIGPEEIRIALESENIESRPLWKPMHLQPVFKGNKVCGGKVSEYLFKRGLCLPSGTAMIDNDIKRICNIIKAAYKNSTIQISSSTASRLFS